MSQRLPPTAASLAILRIGTAGLVIIQAAALGAHLSDLYGEQAILQAAANEVAVYPWTLRLEMLTRVPGLSQLSRDTLAAIVFSIMVLGAHFLLLGIWPRAAAIMTWLAHATLKGSSDLTTYGAYEFVNIALFYCMWMPVADTLAFYGVARGRTRNPFSCYLSIAILRGHVCIVYLAAGLEKAVGEQWWTGEAIWRAASRSSFASHAVVSTSWLPWIPSLAVAAGWLTVMSELLYPLSMWLHRWRGAGLAVVLAMHVSIGLILGIWYFTAIMIILNLSANAPEWNCTLL